VHGVFGGVLGRFLGDRGGGGPRELVEGVFGTRTTVVFVGEVDFVVEFLTAMVHLPSSTGWRGRGGEDFFQEMGQAFIIIYTLYDEVFLCGFGWGVGGGN